MGSDHFIAENEIATMVPISGKCGKALETRMLGNEKSLSPFPKEDDRISSPESDKSFITRTPPKRNSQVSPIRLALEIVKGRDADSSETTREKITMLDRNYPMDPFKRLSSARKLHVNWAPIGAKSFGNMGSLAEKKRSLPESLPLVSACSSSLSSSQKDSSDEDSRQELLSRRQAIKEKIDLYEKMSREGTFDRLNCPGDFDHNSIPTMKLRATYLDNQDPPCDRECSPRVFSDLALSPGHNLPMPEGCRKHRKVSYRIRFAIPEAEYNDCENNRVLEKNFSAKRGGGIRGICGYNRSNDSVSWQESEKINNNKNGHKNNNDLGHKYETLADYIAATDDHSMTNSETSCAGYCKFYRPPDVWVTPFKSKDGLQKWIAKRVWDIEDRDDAEPEYEVDHLCLMHGVRGLMGIPEERGLTAEEWQVNIDERDPWEMTAINDTAPNLPRRTRENYRPKFSVAKISVDGKCEESDSVSLNEDTFFKKLLSVVDFPHLERPRGEESTNQSEGSVLSASDSDTSFISFVDYLDFDGSDTSSVSASLATYDTDDDYFRFQGEGEVEDLQQTRISKPNKRGFGRPDEWVRPNDTYNKASDELKVSFHNERGYGRPNARVRPKDIEADTSKNPSFTKHKERGFGRPNGWVLSYGEDSSESSESTKFHSCHNQRGYGRPDEWVRPQNTYDESSEHSGKLNSGKGSSHNTRGFGRPDEWLRPNDSCGASTECRSCRSPLTSRATLEKSWRESPTEKTTLDDWLEVSNSEYPECVDGDASDCNVKPSLKKERKEVAKKTRVRSSSLGSLHKYSIRYDSDDHYKRGTPTWEKRALQQSEEESNIKLWWQF